MGNLQNHDWLAHEHKSKKQVSCDHTHDHAPQRLIPFLHALILFGLGAYFFYTIYTGNLANYINIRYSWLTQFAVGGFFCLGFVSLINAFSGQSISCCGLSKNAKWKMSLLLVPLVFGFGIASRPLGADAYDDLADAQQALLAHVGTSDIMTAEKIPTPAALFSLANDFMPDKMFSTDKSSGFNILDWLRYYIKTKDKNTMDGKEVNLIGFVTHGKQLPLGAFTVSRFFMRHCIFDTIPIGLYVEWKGSEGLKEDTWVQVHGTFVMTDTKSGQMPIIMAESVDIVPQPETPYLYPETAK